MKVLGSYMIGTMDQRALVADGCIELPRDRIMARHLARADIGDLLWLKEPFALITSRQAGPQNIREIVVGPVGTPPPAHIRHIVHHLRYSPRSALILERADTRATLEIMGILPDAVRCLVHMVQVDEFLKARAA
jgi:hypothetical protein